jgi:hypothetical protein
LLSRFPFRPWRDRRSWIESSPLSWPCACMCIRAMPAPQPSRSSAAVLTVWYVRALCFWLVPRVEDPLRYDWAIFWRARRKKLWSICSVCCTQNGRHGGLACSHFRPPAKRPNLVRKLYPTQHQWRRRGSGPRLGQRALGLRAGLVSGVEGVPGGREPAAARSPPRGNSASAVPDDACRSPSPSAVCAGRGCVISLYSRMDNGKALCEWARKRSVRTG